VVNAAMFMKMMWKAGVSIERQQARVRAGLHVRAGGNQFGEEVKSSPGNTPRLVDLGCHKT
jgi:hypothetical protein